MDLRDRLARLERAHRTQGWLLAAALAATPLAWTLRPALAADAPAAEQNLALAVRNPAGTVVASVRATEDGSSLTLCDAAGKPKMLLAVTKDGPGLYLLDGKEGSANRGVRLALSASERNGPSLALFNTVAAQPAAAVRLKSDGQMGLFVATDGNEKRHAFPKSGDDSESEDSRASAGSRSKSTTATAVGGKKQPAGN